jgi:ubiquinone/menaquinone biosynthesis C-methylase UbiE
MMTVLARSAVSSASAFDRIAQEYDSIFTCSAIGRLQRQVVWNRMREVFPAAGHILELNCGTGVDALFMTNAGMNVAGCDASPRMIDLARQRIAGADTHVKSEFLVLSTEDLHMLPRTRLFDGLLSNFAGLNCVKDLNAFAREAASRLKPGAPLLLCFLTRFCLWESAYYLLQGSPRKALRRCRGISSARVGNISFDVYYRSLSELRRVFASEFRLVTMEGVGITVPPSYLESWIATHPRLLRKMDAIDNTLRGWPGLRVVGDHMLLHLEKVGSC